MALAITLASAALPACGEEASIVLVSAAALPPGLGIDPDRLPYTVRRAGEATRRDSGIDEVSEFMVRQLAGVNVNEVQGNALQNDLSFRGFRLSPTLGAAQGMSVYLDGVRANEPFGDVMNWDMLPQAAIADVLLVAGANPLYGLNTLGGTLAFTTKSGREHPGSEVTMSLGSHDRKRFDLSWGGRREDGWHAFAAATLFDESGWRAHSGGRLGNLFAKVGRHGGATDWDLSLLHGDSSLRGNGLLPSVNAAGGASLYESDRSTAYTHPDITKNRLSQLTLHLRHALGDGSELNLAGYLRRSRRDAVNGDVNPVYADYVDVCADGFDDGGNPAAPDACPYRRAEGAALHTAVQNRSLTQQHSAGATINVTHEAGAHQLLFGVSVDVARVGYSQSSQDGWFAADRGVTADPLSSPMQAAVVDGNSFALGVYASDTWQLTHGAFLTLSARYNGARVSNTLAGQATERFTYRRLNPSIGLVRELGPGTTLFANLAESNRMPTVIELGCADPQQPCRLPVGLQSDPYLKQVVSRTAEAGLRWQAAGTTVSLSFYRSVNRDDILFFASGVSQQGYFANFERTRRQGVDLSATLHRGRLDASLSWSYLDAVYDADGTMFTGQRNMRVVPGTPLAGLPRHTVKLDADWHTGPRTVIGADLVASSSITTQGNEDGWFGDWRVRGHATLDLHASHRADNGWEVFGRLNNLFDRRYETWGSVARDLFPRGVLVQPHISPREAADARFVAPGASRSITIGLRYRM